MKVYLSSPYEHDRADQSWKAEVARTLASVDDRFSVVDPCPDACMEADAAQGMLERGDLFNFYSFCANIVEGDLAMLNQCDGILAYLPCGARTFGTTHEMIHALGRQIPLVMVMPEGIEKVSRWLWGILGPNRLFANVSEAADTLANRILVARGEALNHA